MQKIAGDSLNQNLHNANENCIIRLRYYAEFDIL